MKKSDLTIKKLMEYARGQLIGKYSIAMIAALLPGIINYAVSALVPGGAYGQASTFLIGFFASVVINLLMGTLLYGQASVFLKLARGESLPLISDLFIGFKQNVDKAILIQAPFTLVSVICTLPSVAEFFGLINVPYEKQIGYDVILMIIQIVLILLVNLWLGMCYFIMVDHPDYDVKTVYSESIRLLKGNRLKYLLLHIAGLPLYIAGLLACCVGMFWAKSFMETVRANFYLMLIDETPWSIDKELEETRV